MLSLSARAESPVSWADVTSAFVNSQSLGCNQAKSSYFRFQSWLLRLRNVHNVWPFPAWMRRDMVSKLTIQDISKGTRSCAPKSWHVIKLFWAHPSCLHTWYLLPLQLTSLGDPHWSLCNLFKMLGHMVHRLSFNARAAEWNVCTAMPIPTRCETFDISL